MRVLVSGATGFLGFKLVTELAGRHEVVAMVRSKKTIEHDGVEPVVCGLADSFDAAALRIYLIETLDDPDGVLVAGETDFLKKGDRSVRVARQYSGTTGRIDKRQVGLFLAYTRRFGQALIDRWLYLS